MESRDIYIKLTDPTGKRKPIINAIEAEMGGPAE